MNKCFILLSVFLVTGCEETTYWTKYSDSPDEFDRTQLACHNQIYFMPQTNQKGAQPNYKIEPRLTETNTSSKFTLYKVPFQNLGDAFGSSVTTFKNIARKEQLFENCMVANNWEKTRVSTVALTELVFAEAGPDLTAYKGIATGYMDRTGTIKMKNDSGQVCVGSLRYTKNWTGDGSMRCDDGFSANIEFQGISGFSGYGAAATSKGYEIKFVYGVEEEAIHQYLE